MDFNTVVFWISARQGDWQLFAGQAAYNDLQWAKCVFIYITSGDVGAGDGYWKAKEFGAVFSPISTNPQHTGEKLSSEVVSFNDHPIQRWIRGNVICYFLRLPPGDWNNKSGYEGYSAYQYQTISKLKDGTIPSITTVDKSTVYCGWKDLCDTVTAIMQHEGTGCNTPQWIDTSDPEPSTNPDDHFDRYATGKITADWLQYNRAFWQGNSIAKLPENLDGDEGKKKWIVFMPYALNTVLYFCLNNVTEGQDEQSAMDPYQGRSYIRTVLVGAPQVGAAAMAGEAT